MRRSTSRSTPLRYGLALCAALLVVLGVVHLPWPAAPRQAGWWIDHPPPRAAAHPDLAVETPADAPPASRGLQAAATGRGDAPEARLPTPVRTADVPAPARMLARRMVLEHAEHMPQIRGGIGSFYIHIEYPPAAVAAGIEGRLLLRFVVDVDGVPGEIEVVESLHPLCDSAAVDALRQTLFVPGRQGETLVPVRMHLPVRFRLVGPPGAR